MTVFNRMTVFIGMTVFMRLYKFKIVSFFRQNRGRVGVW